MLEDKAKKYHTIKNWLFVVNTVLSFAILIVLLTGGFSVGFKDLAFRIANNFYAVIGLYFLFLSLTFFVISLPLDIYEGHILEHKFNLATNTFVYWLKKHLKKTALSLLFGIILIEVLYFFLRNFSHIWWILVGIVWFIFSVIIARILPVVIVPLFYKYKNLENDDLKQRIISLAKTCNLKILDVFGIDFSKETKKANAAVIGLGGSRRVVLTDTLISNYSIEEIECVMAHEFGHHYLKHMIKLIFFSAVVTFLSLYILNIVLVWALGLFGFTVIYDIAAFPIVGITLSLFGLLMMPLQNGFSRKLERQADLFALNKTKNKEAFISTMQKLAEQNLAEKSPSKFIEFMLYDHPPISKRIKMAKEMSL